MCIACATQHIHHCADRLLLFCSIHRRKRLLSEDRSIDKLRWVSTHITVSTILGQLLTEVTQQDLSSTRGGLCKLLHPIQLRKLHLFVGRSFRKFSQLDHISKAVKENSLSFKTITAP